MKRTVFTEIPIIPVVNARWVGEERGPGLYQDQKITEVRLMGLTLGGVELEGWWFKEVVYTVVPSDWFFYWLLLEKAKTDKAAIDELKTISQVIVNNSLNNEWVIKPTKRSR